MPDTPDDWLIRTWPWLAEAFCLTYARGLDTDELLDRFGAEGAQRRRMSLVDAARADSGAAGYPTLVLVSDHLESDHAGPDRWSVAVEVNGRQGARPEVLRHVSAGTEAVSVFHHADAAGQFSHAVDGILRTAFDPRLPTDRWGTEPDALAALEGSVGLVPSAEPARPELRALAIAESLTGVTVTPGLLSGRFVAAAVVPWLSDPMSPAPLYYLHQRDPQLADAIDRAQPAVQRQIAVAQAQRLADSAGIADVAAVARGLAAAQRGETEMVGDTSPLGRFIREMVAAGRAATSAYSDPRGGRLRSEEELAGAFARSRAALAVRAALLPDPRVALVEILTPAVDDLDWPTHPRRADIIAQLRAGATPSPGA